MADGFSNRYPLDPTDIAMLEQLQTDGRVTIAELGRRVGLSHPATAERMKRFEERGIVTGYTARVNPAAVGLPMTAIVRLRTTHEHIAACLELFGTIPNVIEVFRLTGEDCFFLKVLVPRPEELEPIVDSIARYGAVTTSLVLRQEQPKPIARNLIPRP
jgi:Lrp/AsnC family leucine-responsive transcriptional regulator